MDTSLTNEYTKENMHPAFSVDCVLFSFKDNVMKILLQKFALSDYWKLPGGFMYNTENADQAANRVLQEVVGQKNIYLKQFHLFSDTNRIIMAQNAEYVQSMFDTQEEGSWLLQRFITLGYYAFMNYNDVRIDVEKQLKWFNIDELPHLYADHNNIIKTSFKKIATTVPIILIAKELLSTKFTMPEIRRIYEIFLNKKYDRRNFQRKILKSELLIQLDERENTKAYNPPYLYAFDEEKLKQLNERF